VKALRVRSTRRLSNRCHALVCRRNQPPEQGRPSSLTNFIRDEILANLDRSPDEVHDVPIEIENEVATLKLASMGIRIDSLTSEQKKYLESWTSGT